ncbi:hypothetical protein FEM48_Zijuj09G0052100 [Ziziphus jujuba var. spinosa]|uniref:Cytochrome P450 94A1-like n=1 Tax=Ziziphus jujuba var. spinosa TaxID=714518 RepID=A0A978UR30_ZIZJJ|nr:hypothetical protein FEM48_Zijuj09G0052100 [Ziziphus jujuba var. spinosa]
MNIPPQLLVSSFLFILPLLFLFVFTKKKNKSSPNSTKQQLPKSYPLVGHYFSISPNQHRRNQYTTEVLQNSPAATFVFRLLFGASRITTANPSVVQHILKTNFSIYQKGDAFRIPLTDFLGEGIFNADGDNWKFQRQVASHEFNTKSLRKFDETVVETEFSHLLLPILSEAASDNSVLDFQDVLQSQRSLSFVPWVWKIKKIFGIRSEKQLAQPISEVQDFATHIVREKKKELAEKSSVDSVDMLAVAGVLRRFRVVSTMAEGTEPVFISHLTSKMKGGFPVRFVERGGIE